MFGSKRRLAELIERLRPDLGPESLGVGPDFPSVTPKPLLSGETRMLDLDVETRDGMSFTSGRHGGFCDVSRETSLNRVRQGRASSASRSHRRYFGPSPSRPQTIGVSSG